MTDSDGYNCPVCDANFTKPYSLSLHVKKTIRYPFGHVEIGSREGSKPSMPVDSSDPDINEERYFAIECNSCRNVFKPDVLGIDFPYETLYEYKMEYEESEVED